MLLFKFSDKYSKFSDKCKQRDEISTESHDTMIQSFFTKLTISHCYFASIVNEMKERKGGKKCNNFYLQNNNLIDRREFFFSWKITWAAEASYKKKNCKTQITMNHIQIR